MKIYNALLGQHIDQDLLQHVYIYIYIYIYTSPQSGTFREIPFESKSIGKKW